MKDDEAFDRATSQWLGAGSDHTPERALEAVLFAIRTTPQERHLPRPWGTRPMPYGLPVVAAIAVLAVLGISTLTVVNPGLGPSGGGALPATPSPSPSASPTQGPIDTSSWIPFVSGRYGFSIAHPDDWEPNRAARDWAFPADALAAVPGSATELFESTTNPDTLGVWVAAWSVQVAPGTMAAEWIADYCSYKCRSGREQTVPATLDGHAGLLLPSGGEVHAFFLVDDRMYVVALWRPADGLSVMPYGGGRRLVEAFLSTVRLLPDGPPAAPSSSPPG